MKMRSKILSFIAVILVFFTLSGCDSIYLNSYKATGLKHGIRGHECFASFETLDGTYVFKMKYRGKEDKIYYAADVESGEVNIYYDSLGVKEKLFTAEAGYPIEGNTGYVDRGTVYIILEAENAKNGSIKIRLGGDGPFTN
jgi:uncharacterized lipoprotein YehR (DUF1307 family)